MTTCMIKRLRNQWLKISLKKKLGIYAVMLSLVVGLSVICTIVAMNFVVNSFNTILEDNSRCHDFQEAMELEANAFAGYMRDKSEERRQEYVLACVRTERCLRSLPFNYEEIGSERYARTWNIKNGYENYSLMRENVLEMDSWGEDYITTLYDVYEMQDYLQSYARRLVQVTLKEGNGSYLKKLPNIYNIRYVILIFPP